LIDVKPMPMAPRDLSVFTIFAARARAELERKRAEEARARSEERLSSVLASAMDAIITIDGERHITLFNPAAEPVFGCAATWAVGQPLNRFLSRRFRSLLEECIATARDKTAQRWAPGADGAAGKSRGVSHRGDAVALRGGGRALPHADPAGCERAQSHRGRVKLNCAALPGELIESELFGHEKGFSPAPPPSARDVSSSPTAEPFFSMRWGSSLLPAQAKLLRALQEQEFERVGGTKTLRVDVRVIAATNRDLREAVKAGRFRSDLYYRINVFPLEVPPLRERREDIPLLAQHFLRRFAKKLGKPLEDIGRASMERLARYGWPGNIRELQNVIERAAVLAPGPIIEVELRLGPPGVIEETVPLNGTLEEVERAHIQRMLEETGWLIEGKQGAAAHLGLSPSTLRYRMQKLGIKRPPAVY
jgi:transcriptional regulator with PAS, ATPase and Fis domain